MLSKDEFETKYLYRLLGLHAESYATRHCPPGEYGLQVDRHTKLIRALFADMYAAMNPPLPSGVPTNGSQKSDRPGVAGNAPGAAGAKPARPGPA